MCAFSGYAFAAEVVGIITEHSGRGAQGAAVTVTCGEFKETAITAFSGQYRVVDVPDGSACTLTNTYKGASSEPEAFSVTSDRMSFSRKVRQYQGRLVIF
jgi:hypothetical protein